MSGEDAAAAVRARREGVTRQAVEWGFRMLAGRPPLNDVEVRAFLAMPSLDAMRRTLANTHEFHAFFDAFHTGFEAWTVPLFLLRPSAVPDLEWRFAPPDLERPGCQFCTAAQFRDAAYAEIAGAMGLPPGIGRNRWEQVWIVSVLASWGFIAPGRRGLGLLVGQDRVAALVASRGVEVLATDQPDPDGQEPALRRMQQFHPEAVGIEAFDRLIHFAELEPARIGEVPADSFDFCWSRGVPGALGSIGAALDFFEASLVPVVPGGLALHCFAVNLTSDTLTWEEKDNAPVRRSDIEALAQRLHAAGHRLLPLSTHPGAELEDEMVHSPLGGPQGLRQRRGMMVHTSFGLAIRKAA